MSDHHQWFLTQLPRMLMATVSVLLEHVFRTRSRLRRRNPLPLMASKKDRVMVQVLLWLTAATEATNSENSLQYKYNLPFEALLHAIFFANLMGIIAPSFLAATIPSGPGSAQPNLPGAIQHYGGPRTCFPRRKAPSDTSHQQLGAEMNHPFSLESIFTKIAPSLWISLVLSYVEQGSYNGSGKTIEPTYYYLGVAGAVFFLSILISWWIHHFQARMHQRNQHFQPAMPTTTRMMDEHNWCQWNVSKVAEWLSETLVGMNEKDIVDLTSRLAYEGVDGEALDFLDMDALRHMDIPYGLACRVLDHVRSCLTRRYPRPHRESLTAQNGGHEPAHNSSSLSGHPEAQMNVQNQFYPLESRSSRLTEMYMEEDEMEKARNTMMQRFGFHLPEPSKGKSDVSPASNMEDIQANHQGVATQSGMESTHSGEESKTALDNALLSSMPPHIRQIVQRKPHLWQQAQQKQMNQQQNVAQGPQTDRQSATAHLGPEYSSTLQQQNHQQSAQATPASSLNVGDEISPSNIPPSILENLPPNLREIAQRNPELFWKMLSAKQQGPPAQASRAASGPITEETEEDLAVENENDELAQLIPERDEDSSGGWLRQRPGF